METGNGQWTMGLEYIVSRYNTLKSLVIKGPMRTFSSELLDLVFSPTKVALCFDIRMWTFIPSL